MTLETTAGSRPEKPVDRTSVSSNLSGRTALVSLLNGLGDSLSKQSELVSEGYCRVTSEIFKNFHWVIGLRLLVDLALRRAAKCSQLTDTRASSSMT